MNKILILGDGLLGTEIVKQSSWDFVSRKRTNFDITNLEESIPTGYNVIINCIANTNTYSNDRDSHWQLNYKFVYDLIIYCNTNKIKLVHISTDYVYTGSIENSSENDVPVHCNNWYGYTKLLGDSLVQLLSDDYVVFRCGHKPNPFPYDKGWSDQIGNFDYVDVISGLIIEGVNNNLYGVYNIGTEKKSIYELAIKTKNVTPVNSPQNVPKNITMNTEKYKNITKI